jgi:hypothetical protein
VRAFVSQLVAKKRERNRYGTVGKGFKVLLEVCLGALAARTDRNGKVLKRAATRREFV